MCVFLDEISYGAVHENFIASSGRNSRTSRNFFASAVYTFRVFFFRCIVAAECETGWSLNLYREALVWQNCRSALSARKVFASLLLLLDSGRQDARNTSYPRKEDFRSWKSNDKGPQRKKFSLLTKKEQPSMCGYSFLFFFLSFLFFRYAFHHPILRQIIFWHLQFRCIPSLVPFNNSSCRCDKEDFSARYFKEIRFAKTICVNRRISE